MKAAAGTTDAEQAEIAGELGLCELALRKDREAADHLAQSLKHHGALSSSLQRRVADGLQKAEERVATLYLGVNPPDAEVLVDGEPLGRPASTYEVFLEPGQHTVRVRLVGHAEMVSSFDVVAGKVHTLALKLQREPDGAAPGSGAATAARPANGVARPSAPGAPSAAGAARPAAGRARSRLPATELRIGGVALAAATGALGTVFLVRAAVLHDDYRERGAGLRTQGWQTWSCHESGTSPACAELRALRKERALFSTLGLVSVATSGVFAVATAVSFWNDLSRMAGRPRRDGVRVVPLAAEGQAGVSLRGVW
ncbi:PEGA domain-containing protein [Sorangium sp. So ce1389]|uniref:PEGA domain-containing protein n=1 Tax=Sorangium sp. So ce1389 TaxID=3133336 RepID=UPI003F645412